MNGSKTSETFLRQKRIKNSSRLFSTRDKNKLGPGPIKNIRVELLCILIPKMSIGKLKFQVKKIDVATTSAILR